jgi:hypothetical protein
LGGQAPAQGLVLVVPVGIERLFAALDLGGADEVVLEDEMARIAVRLVVRPEDRCTRRRRRVAAERLEAADPRHVLLHPEAVALDPLLQVFGDVMEWIMWQEAGFPGCRDGGWVGTRTIGADPVRGEQRLMGRSPRLSVLRYNSKRWVTTATQCSTSPA